MKNLELINGLTIAIQPESVDENLEVDITQVNGFSFYGYDTLLKVFEIIDENPKDYNFINVNEIMKEHGIIEDYETFINLNLGISARLFLESFLQKLNEQTLSNYTENIVFGEEKFFGMIVFTGVNNDEGVEKLLNIERMDSEGIITELLENSEWETEEDIFYILQFTTRYL